MENARRTQPPPLHPPAPLRLRTPRERVAYALGTAVGLVSPTSHPLMLLSYYYNGVKGKPFTFMTGQPPQTIKTGSVCAFYAGRIMTIVTPPFPPPLPAVDEGGEWFRWGLDVGRDEGCPVDLELIPAGRTTRQAWILGYTMGMAFPARSQNEVLPAYTEGFTSPSGYHPLPYVHLQGEQYVSCATAFYMGRMQRKTASDSELPWYSQGFELGRTTEALLLYRDGYVFPNAEDPFKDHEEDSPDDESFMA